MNIHKAENYHMRNPNASCAVCEKPIYRRPSVLLKCKNVYCGRPCFHVHHPAFTPKQCASCGNTFQPIDKDHNYCSKSCANSGRKGINYIKDGWGSQPQRRLNILRIASGFTTCMVEGCSFSLTFDIHRHIPGSLGGKYVIGNMFAICPNHHALVTRGLVKYTKVNDFLLRIDNTDG